MKRYFFCLSILLISLLACTDDNSDAPNQQIQNPTTTSGSLAATIDGLTFWTNDVTARFRSNGHGFFIVAQDDDGRYLLFTMTQFLGNGEFTVAPDSNISSSFTDVENGENIFYTEAVGTITIENYDSIANTFDASFSMFFTNILDNSVIEGTGSYSQLQILTLPEPAPGEMNVFYLRGEFYNEHSVSARVAHTNILQITFSRPNNPNLEIQVYMDAVNDPESVSILSGLWRELTHDEIISWEFDDVAKTVSGHLKERQAGDYEIWFSEIPYEDLPPLELEEGEILFYNGEDTILFDDGYFEIEYSNSINYTFESTNIQGDRLYFQASESIPYNPFDDDHIPGRYVVIEYQSEGNPTFYKNGRFTTSQYNGTSNKKNIFFESIDREVFMRSKGIDFL